MNFGDLKKKYGPGILKIKLRNNKL